MSALRTVVCGMWLGVLGACAHAAPPAPASLRDVSPAALYARGLELADQGDYVPAEQFLEAARARGYPEDAVVKQLVKVCVASSRFDSALGYAVPYLERHPEAWPLRQVVATIHLALGDAALARAQLEELLAQRPHEAEGHFLLAVVLRDEYGDGEAARHGFARYVELAPHGEHASEARAWLARTSRPAMFREVTP